MNDQEASATTGDMDKTGAVLAWILGIVIGVFGPLIIFLLNNDQNTTDPSKKFSRDVSKTALNWQITAMIGYIVGGVLMIVIVGFFIWGAVVIMNLIFCILGAMNASKGENWKSPLTIPILK